MEMRADLVAPCGMNCRLCYAFVRKKNPCFGCNGPEETKMASCAKCTLKTCEKRAASGDALCAGCETPCRRLKQLDARYREKYHMSMRNNLAFIQKKGMAAFLAKEEERWRCPACGGVLCVHRAECPGCGAPTVWPDE